jgi:hypothetical protein
MTYEAKPIRRQKVRYDNANTDNPLRTQLVINGAKVNPTSATITIYRPGSTTALVTAAAMTVSGSLLTYPVDTTTEASWPKEHGYRADVSIVYSTVTYKQTLVFDVVGYLLNLGIGRDQLLATDDTVRGMEWAGDEDFSEVIEAARDDIQLLIETKVIEDHQLIENMILDSSRIAIAARWYILHLIFFTKDEDKSARCLEKFDKLFGALLAGIAYDKDESGEEEPQQGRVQPCRLVM